MDIETREEEVDRSRRALRRLVRDSGLTQRQIEEINGFARGYLSQVLQGHITLTLRHVLGILMATGISAADFFAELLSGQRDEPALGQISEIRERMARYDSALQELEDKGILDPAPGSSTGPTRR